ncbi:MAG: hypothetical protein ACRCYD_03770, partial [Plesiomonas sp.]
FSGAQIKSGETRIGLSRSLPFPVNRSLAQLSNFPPCITRYTVTNLLTLLPVELAGLSHRLPVHAYPV